MTASSQLSDSHQASFGRVNGSRGLGWCAITATDPGEWLQIDFNKTIDVCAVATQGGRNGWVKKFKLQFSSTGEKWMFYKKENGVNMVRLYTVTELCSGRTSVNVIGSVILTIVNSGKWL